MEAVKNKDVKNPIEFTVPAGGTGSFYIQEDIREDFYSHYHRHKEIQITYMVSGRGAIVLGNLIQPFIEDEIFILKANDPHIFLKENGLDQNIHAIHVFLGFDKLKSLFDLQELQPIRDFYSQLDSSKKLAPIHSLGIRQKFLDLQQVEGLNKFRKVLDIFDYLLIHDSSLISLYSGLPESNFNDKVGVRINEVLRYTLEHFKNDISIDEVAKLIYMTPSAFCKYFKKHTMKTYVTFLNEVRIEKACQYLINRSTVSISEVAYLCGFNTVVHFNRVFKQIMGVSPSEFVHKHSFIV